MEKGIKLVSIENEMKSSYLDYAMSVIIGRALPDVRDGLKPVHRRILFAMKSLGLFHNKPFRKSATVVGEVLGKFHPHGDQAVYDTLVRMVQDFSLRYPLLAGQGNFGSVDGDSAAAYRYTETKLNKIAADILADIDKNTVDFEETFDGTHKEPVVLPSKFPNLLVNGSSGIAVGMATNIPPHNLGEVIDACIELIENSELSNIDLLKIIPGPDFPTGGIIVGRRGIEEAYLTGKGKVIVEAKLHIEEIKKKKKIIITEIPYMVNKSLTIIRIADLVKSKKIEGISSIRDESDRKGMRIVIELKRDFDEKIVLNQLYKHSQLRQTFGCILLAIDKNKPKMLTLREMLSLFLEHRKEVVLRRTKYELNEAEKRAHILEGLKKALDNIDLVISIIRKSKDTQTAKDNLKKKLELSDIQAQAILDMKLSRLTSLEVKKLEKEYLELIKEIARLRAIIESKPLLMKVIKDELKEIKLKYADKRKTEILDNEVEEIFMEDLIQDEDVVITLTHKGYIKRLTVDKYRQQGRGGKGVKGTRTSSEDNILSVYTASTHDYLLCFTDRGQLHWLKVYRIPEVARDARGRSLVNLLSLDKEKVKAVIAVKDFSEDKFVFMCTKKGIVKKCSLSVFSKPRKKSIKAITLDWDDELISSELTNGEDDIILISHDGKAMCFKENEVRKSGRTSRGVIGIRMTENDFVIGTVCYNKNTKGKDIILTACENGYGKLTQISNYPKHHRGGKGVIGINTSKRNGKVVLAQAVDKKDEAIFISFSGQIIRLSLKDVRKTSRNTQGVRLMKLNKDDKLVSAAIVQTEEEEKIEN